MQATLFMSLGIKNYSQWFRGDLNDVSDSLAQDNDRTDKKLINIYCSLSPSQIPSHFKIVPLPNKITSWLTALLQKLSANQQYNKVYTQSKLWRGNVGASTTIESETMTSSSNLCPSINKSKSFEPLPWPFKKDGFWDQLMTDWLKTQPQVTGNVSYVCTTFRENSFPNPSLDNNARTGFLLQRLYWGFKKADPAEKHQKAIPMCVIAELGRKTISELSITIPQLTSLTIFFACRSCKYLRVPAADQQRTMILQICNIRFFRNGNLINHDDDKLEFSDCISLTFEKQKKESFAQLVQRRPLYTESEVTTE